MKLLVKNSLKYWNYLPLFLAFFLGSCTENCPSDKVVFQNNMNELIKEINTKKRTKTDYEWDLIDKKMRKMLLECQPKFSNELSNKENIIFWENAIGYAYVRFGPELLKKYGQSDFLLLKIRDNVSQNKIEVKSAVKRLCKEWPVLYGSSEEAISDLIKDVMFLRKKKGLITVDSLVN